MVESSQYTENTRFCLNKMYPNASVVLDGKNIIALNTSGKPFNREILSKSVADTASEVPLNKSLLLCSFIE
jgi:hypothetical protein